MTCIHRGELAGELISVCCQQQEKRFPLFHCLSEQCAAKYAAENGGAMALASIEIAGERSMAKVGHCLDCQYVTEPEPVVREPKKYIPPEPVKAGHAVVVHEKVEVPEDAPRPSELWAKLRAERRARKG